MNATRRQIEMPDSWQGEDALAPGAEGTGKIRYPRALALEVARELVAALRPFTTGNRLKVCGSLRRLKADVGDVEIVFVPELRVVKAEERDLFSQVTSEQVDEPVTASVLDELVVRGVLRKRLKSDGTTTWGRWNRLAVHVASGIPVDFFGCLEASWWNTVVCRTGGARTNTEICQAAILRGWHWEPSPTEAGFRRRKGLAWERHAVASEREVFEFVGLKYLEPEARR